MSVVARRPGARPAEMRIGTLFDEHAPMVLGLCRYLLRDSQAAEDAAQETFLSAYRSLLRGTRPRDPAAWLATIARNHCRRAWRTTRTAPLDESNTVTVLDPADIVADRAVLSDVTTAIAELPARQREALVLREFCGLSYEQVAAAMRLSGSAVDSLLSRARRRLSERLGYLPRTARGALVVPASLREELSRLIPGLDSAGAAAGVASGAGGAATLASLGSAPLVAKVAATGAAAVALALPVQGTVRVPETPRAAERPRALAQAPEPYDVAPSSALRLSGPAASAKAASSGRRGSDRSGSGSSGSGSHGSGSGTSGSGSSGSGAGSTAPSSTAGASSSSDSGSAGVGSAPSGSASEGSRSGSGSSGSGSSGSGSSTDGSGSSSGDSGSSGSGTSGSGTSDSGSSGSGSSSSSGSDSGSSGTSGSGSGSAGGSGSGSFGSGSGDSGSGGSGSGGSGSNDPPEDG
jgi:RNA polymerase sigma factor (sigma-70 family)